MLPCERRACSAWPNIVLLLGERASACALLEAAIRRYEETIGLKSSPIRSAFRRAEQLLASLTEDERQLVRLLCSHDAMLPTGLQRASFPLHNFLVHGRNVCGARLGCFPRPSSCKNACPSNVRDLHHLVIRLQYLRSQAALACRWRTRACRSPACWTE
jgi:hypothetical protein